MSDAGEAFGPATERLTPAQRAGDDQFVAAVSLLADGELIFPPPFDLATAAALCRNTSGGDAAERNFERACDAVPRQFRLRLHQVAPGTGVEPREIVDTTVPGLLQILTIVHGLVAEMLTDDEKEC